MNEEDRAALGLDVLDSPARRGWQQALDTARNEGIHTAERAGRLAGEVNNKPRALSDIETAGLVQRMAELKNQHKAATEAAAGGDQSASNEAAAIEHEFDALSTAIAKSGTEKGRALAAQKLTLDQDFSLVEVKTRAKAAKGKPLTRAESAALERMSTQLEETNQRVADLETQISEMAAQQAVRQHRAGRRRPATVRKAEFDATLAQARALLKQGCR